MTPISTVSRLAAPLLKTSSLRSAVPPSCEPTAQYNQRRLNFPTPPASPHSRTSLQPATPTPASFSTTSTTALIFQLRFILLSPAARSKVSGSAPWQDVPVAAAFLRQLFNAMPA